MRVGIDVRPVQKRSSRRRGIGRYTRQLVESLIKANSAGHELVLFAQHADPPTFGGNYELRTVFQLNRPGRLAWVPDLAVLPRAIRQSRVRVFHATDIMAIPKTRGCKVVLTLHDLIPFIYWEQTKQSAPVDFALALRYGLSRVRCADRIVTDSVHSKSDICMRLGFPEEKVSVVYPGYHPAFGPRERCASARRLAERYGLKGPFLLYVGGSDFRKNLGFLVDAFHELARLGYAGQLVLVGETFEWNIPEVAGIKRKVSAAGIEDRVVYPGFVPDSDLPDFYACCDLFVFPSLYEGFGFPVLEAFACGAPVLASDSSSIPEVGGDGCEYFSATDSGDFIRGFERVINDPARRQAMIEKGLERARLFSWERAAAQVLALYESYDQ